MHIYNSSTSDVIAFVDDYDLEYISNDLAGKFIANNGMMKSMDIKINDISKISLTNLEYVELSSLNGGDIAVREDSSSQEKKLVTENAYFKINAQILENNYDLKTRIDGELIININSQSLITRAFLTAYNTIIQESGF